jgi:hypothetical protein
MPPPPPALSLGADARSIHAFSSCLGAGEAVDTEWDTAGWRGRTALAAAVSAQAKTIMTANSIAAAGDATMLTSTV